MEERHEIRFESIVEKFDGPGGWHAVFLPPDAVAETRFFGRANTLGTIAIIAKVGDTAFKTALFPDRRRESYLLPLKADVRRRESILQGDRIAVSLRFTG